MQVFMKGKIKVLYKDRFLLYSTVLIVVFFTIFSLLIILSSENLPPLIPLFSSMPWGMRRLYASEVVIFLPIIIMVVSLVNISLAVTIYNKFALLSRLVSFNTFLFCFLATLAYLQILFLVY